MIFLSKHNKKTLSSQLLRVFGGAITAIVVTVGVFGPYADIVYATPRPVTELSREITTLTPQLNTAITTARNSTGADRTTAIAQVQSLQGQIYNDIQTMVAQPGGRTDSSLTDARAALASADSFKAGDGAGGLTQAERNGNQVQTQDRAAPNSSSGSTPPAQKKPATHPLEICIDKLQISMCVAGIFYVFFVDLTAPIAYLAGAVFDAFAGVSLTSGTYASLIIAKGWQISRDVANMAFVFILIYLAFMLILNLEGVGVGKDLAKIIAVALLINFSFFFSRVIIDASNILAHVFYDNIVATEAPVSGNIIVQGLKQAGSTINSAASINSNIKSISEIVMAGLNPQTLLSNDNFTKFINGGTFLGNVAILLVLFLIFGIINVILAAVFLTAAFQFLTRIIALWFAIILSPIAFISFMTPHGGSLWKKWLSTIINNAFYAPAFLFVVYIAIAMLDNGLLSKDIASFLGGSVNNSTGADGIRVFLNQIVGVILRLGVIVGLFIGALKVGSFMGTQSAAAVEKLGGRLAVGGSAAAVGFAARNTAGRLGYAVTRSETVRNAASGNMFKDKTFIGAGLLRGVTMAAGRGAEVSGGKLATSSFDGRASGIPGAGVGGKAQSGGYKKDLDNKTKAIEHIEHERHDTPEEGAAKISALKNSQKFSDKRASIENEITDAEQAEATATLKLNKATENLALARSSGTGTAIKTAEADLAAAEAKKKAAQDEAKSARDGKEKKLKALDKEIEHEAHGDDEARKKSYTDHLKSNGVHNLWGANRTATDRAAAKIIKGKSKKDNFLEAAKAIADEEKGDDGHGEEKGGGDDGHGAPKTPKGGGGPASTAPQPKH